MSITHSVCHTAIQPYGFQEHLIKMLLWPLYLEITASKVQQKLLQQSLLSYTVHLL